MKAIGTLLFVLLAGLLLAPRAAGSPLDMGALWPNDDGRSWTYDAHFQSFDLDPATVDESIRLFLDGATIAPDGIDAQYLHHQLLSGGTGASAPALALASLVPDPLLRQLYIARPELQARILAAQSAQPCPESAPAGRFALLLNGEFAYRKTATEIAAWRCNLANTRSWQWLAADLTVGSTFTLQLVPDLASNVYLHGTVSAIEPASVPAGEFAGCVRVDYVIDYGTSDCTNSNGDVIGIHHAQTTGFVRYAAGVGPVESSESFAIVEATGGCSATGTLSVATMKLSSMPVPVRGTTWGRIKSAYR